MSGRTEPDWNRWEASLGRVQAVREWRSFPCKAALQTSDLNCRGATGTLETTFLLVGATGFEPATFRPPAERTHASMCLGASVISYVSTAVDDLDR